MILTVTLNTAIDKVLLIDEFTPGLPMQAQKVVTSVGGKGLDAAVTLRHLGVETVGLAFVAGENGRQLANLIETYGIIPELVWVDGETRICYVIAEAKAQRVSHIKVGELQISSHHTKQFQEVFLKRLAGANWVICAGSIPKSMPLSFYAILVLSASQAGVPVLVDSTQDAILVTLAHHPDIVKLNWEEFVWTFKKDAISFDNLVSQAGQVYSQHNLNSLIITCGSRGLLAFTREGIFHAYAPLQAVTNAAGAGDAVSAALVWRLSLGDTWPTALKWAVAAGAAAVLTEGTADCRISDVHAILPDTAVEQLSIC